MADSWSLEIGHRSDLGRAWDQNEDSVAFIQPTESAQRKRRGHFLAVADGTISLEEGVISAEQVTRRVAEEYYRADRALGVRESLARAIQSANAELREATFRLSARAKANVGFVGAVVRGRKLLIARAGGCRAYIVRGGSIRLVTNDVGLSAGGRTPAVGAPDEKPRSPRKAALSRAIGADERVEPEFFEETLRPTDRIVLCSDGLFDVLADEEIRSIVATRPPARAADELAALAASRDGSDNASVLVVRPNMSLVAAFGSDLMAPLPVAVAIGALAIVAVGALVATAPRTASFAGGAEPTPSAATQTPVEQVASLAPSPTSPAPTLTTAPTATQAQPATPTAAAPTSTVAPSPTAQPTVTPPPASTQVNTPTAVTEPTRTAVPEPSPTEKAPTPTPMATPTRRPQPTATPPPPTQVPTPAPHPSPALAGTTTQPFSTVLAWSYPGPLAADETFDVRVWRPGSPPAGIANTRDLSYAIGGNFPSGTYNWTVAVIKWSGGTAVQLASAGSVGQFTWAGSPGSGGSAPGAPDAPSGR